MKIATLVFRRYIASGSRGVKRRIWSSVRKALIDFLGDPICSFPIHGRNLKLPLSHSLPDYMNEFPLYDRLPQRISEYVHQTQGHLCCIDVGANIGDTITSFYKEDSDVFFAVEPNPKFNALLMQNWGWNKNITIVSEICSSGSDQGTFEVRERNGTSSIVQTGQGVEMRRRSLDEMVNDHPAADANVLKVDTDGYDFEVIKGARQLLARNLPVVLFECDVFGNEKYVQDCFAALDLLRTTGYNCFLVYSNVGYLMGRYSLSDLSSFRNLLFFQLTSPFGYFDILVMKDKDLLQFHKNEVDFYASEMRNKSLRQTALTAVEVSAAYPPRGDLGYATTSPSSAPKEAGVRMQGE